MINIVYNYHPVTFEYLGEGVADESPLEVGTLLYPAHSTPKKPPVTVANEMAIFSIASDLWSIVPDFRGQTMYDQATGAAVVIDVLGAITPNLSAVKPAHLVLDEAKASRITYIEDEYELREHADIVYMGATFQAGDASQKLIDRVLAAQNGSAPSGFGWYDINNIKVPMTNADLQGLANAIFLRNQPLFDNKQLKKAAIRAIQPSPMAVDEVNAVVW